MQIELELPEEKRIFDVRNIFLFMFYCAGVRVGDCLRLRFGNIEGDILFYDMAKNADSQHGVTHKDALKIVELYKTPDKTEDDYIFPFLDNKISYTPEYLDNQISAKTALINNYLSKIADLAHIKKHITSHIARHSFADFARQKNISVYEISKALRHSSIQVTESYLSAFDTISMRNTLNTIFDNDEPEKE